MVLDKWKSQLTVRGEGTILAPSIAYRPHAEFTTIPRSRLPGGNNMNTSAIRILFLAALLTPSLASGQSGAQNPIPTQHNEATVAQLPKEMASGMLTSQVLTREYIARILALDHSGPVCNAVLDLNPHSLVMGRNAGA